jgi:hypothetical protein
VSRRVWERRNSGVRVFLQGEYGGKCQVCQAGFIRRDGEPYFEGMYLIPRIARRWIDHEGNVLGLCPTCCTQFMHGAVEASDIVTQIKSLSTADGCESKLRVTLCGKPRDILYSKRHVIALQAIMSELERGD